MSSRVEAVAPGVIVVLIGLAFAIGGFGYRIVSEGRMGPGLMPFIAGVGLVVLGAGLAISASRSAVSAATATDAVDGAGVGGDAAVADVSADTEEPNVADAEVHHPWRPWLVLGTIVAGLAVVPLLGLIPALTLVAFVILRFIERETWRASLLVTAGILVLSWLIFDRFLKVTLPWGVFGGLI